jgi:hypothetical protein
VNAVNHPAHYNQGGVECIDAIAAALGREGEIAFLRGQVIKYVWRLGLKGPAVEDAAKAAWYLARLRGLLGAPASEIELRPPVQEIDQPAPVEPGWRAFDDAGAEAEQRPQPDSDETEPVEPDLAAAWRSIDAQQEEVAALVAETPAAATERPAAKEEPPPPATVTGYLRAEAFLAQLERTGSPTAALVAMGRIGDKSTAYKARREDAEFARRWEEALARHDARLADAASPPAHPDVIAPARAAPAPEAPSPVRAFNPAALGARPAAAVKAIVFDADGKTWCDQCDQRVHRSQAAACASPFCRARRATAEAA